MNNDRRAALEQIKQEIDCAFGQLEALRDEEQEYYDNMPDSFRDGEKGANAEEAVNNLDEAMENLRSAIDNIEVAQS